MVHIISRRYFFLGEPRFTAAPGAQYPKAMADRFTLPSFAKINLCLEVMGKRPDGFHELRTIFQTVSLTDEISFSRAPDLTLTCSDPQIAVGEENLVMRAARRLQSAFGCSAGAAIHLVKRIPSPGGLGGGSSNAAVALLTLNRLWEINAGQEELYRIAGGIGSDVAFFLYGGTAYGAGRGEKLERIDDFSAEFLVIVTPEIAVSTAWAYRELDAQRLTSEGLIRNLSVCRFEPGGALFERAAMRNDFESVVYSRFPEIERIKEKLEDFGAAAMLSGSGASVFGVFENEETRQTALEALGEEAGWRSFAVATISRSAYREALEQVF